MVRQNLVSDNILFLLLNRTLPLPADLKGQRAGKVLLPIYKRHKGTISHLWASKDCYAISKNKKQRQKKPGLCYCVGRETNCFTLPCYPVPGYLSFKALLALVRGTRGLLVTGTFLQV